MTKLEELKAAFDVAYADWDSADYVDADARDAAWVAAWDAWIAYRAELIKTQKEQTND